MNYGRSGLNLELPDHWNVTVIRQPLKKTTNPVYTILDSIVNITATLDPSQDAFNILITKGSDSFSVWTSGMFFKTDTLSELKKIIGWKGKYLFVQSRNINNIWNGSYDCVYTLKDGHLIHVGNITTSYNGVGSMFQDGYFKHFYDKLEYTELTGHAGSRGIWLVMTEVDGHFKADINRTWKENSKEYNESVKRINYVKRYVKDQDSLSSLAPDLIFSAMLTKYCNKKDELSNILITAKSCLTKEDNKKFSDIVTDVIPQEVPKADGEGYKNYFNRDVK